MTDALDAKIAAAQSRFATRGTDRRDQVRKALARDPLLLSLADNCKSTFGARLAYLKTADVELGTDPFPRPGCVWTFYLKPKVKRGN